MTTSEAVIGTPAGAARAPSRLGHLHLLISGFPDPEQEREWQEDSVVQWATFTDWLGLVVQVAIMLGINAHMGQARVVSTWRDASRVITATCCPLSWACALLW
jgi:hypothetical protein